MRAAGIGEAPAGWLKGGGAPPLWPWALGEGAWTTKLPLIVGREGWTSWSASLPLSPRARCLCPSREPVMMGLAGHYLGGLGCPVTSRSWRLLSQGCGTQASAQLPLSQRGASGHMEPCGGIELQLPVVSLMPPCAAQMLLDSAVQVFAVENCACPQLCRHAGIP